MRIGLVDISNEYLKLTSNFGVLSLGQGYNVLEFDVILWNLHSQISHSKIGPIIEDLELFLSKGKNLVILYSPGSIRIPLPGLKKIIEVNTLKGSAVNFHGDKHNSSLSRLKTHQMQYTSCLYSPDGEIEPVVTAKEGGAILCAKTNTLSGITLLMPLVNPYYQVGGGTDLINDLDNFFNSFKTSIKNIQIPTWFSEFETETERLLKSENEKLSSAIISINHQISENILKIEELEKLKLLLVADGDALEELVKTALEELEINVYKGDQGKVDFILEYENFIGVCEVKGLSGSAAERNVRQVETWKGLYEDRHSLTPKGILIVNTFKLKNPSLRTDPSFPEPMMEYVKVAKTCLITTLQLYKIILETRHDPSKRKAIVQSMFQTIGRLEY